MCHPRLVVALSIPLFWEKAFAEDDTSEESENMQRGVRRDQVSHNDIPSDLETPISFKEEE